MPSDANGVYTLPDGYLAVTGNTILASQHNPPLEDLAESMSQRVMATGAKPFSGPAKFADGTVSAPAITMASATSSGWYKTADGWGFSIGGVMVAEITAGGIRTGARYVGEVFDWTGSTAPSLCVFPYGQTLSRTTYARLWAFAQVEIAAGSLLYNNGNGSTTFGIPDMRGRVRAAKDNSGAVLTSATMTPDGNSLGAKGGTQMHQLTTAELAVHNHGVTDTGHFHVTGPSGVFGGSSAGDHTPGGVASPNGSVPLSNYNTDPKVTGISINNAGSGSAHNNVQPTIITNCALYAGD